MITRIRIPRIGRVRLATAVVASLTVLLISSEAARGWHTVGHSSIAAAAVRALPAEMPAFFRKGGAAVAHNAVDPDAFKDRTTPMLRSTEAPDHYIDLELLKGKPLPATRYEFLKLCVSEGISPENVGLVPYSIAEWTERLTIAFAEHRKWPTNPHIQAKALVYAGTLAHYSGDVCQPLHTTIHHDGRAGDDGKTPRSGIHTKVDSLVERLELKPADLARGVVPAPLPALLPGILAELGRSHALVDRVYELEKQLPPAQGEWQAGPEIRAFTEERGRAAARFTASLYLTAWRNSEKVSLPDWLTREEIASTTPAPKPILKRQARGR